MTALKIEENKPLAPRTTIGIGGPARFFLTAKTEEDVLDGLRWAKASQLPVFFLGGGSNLLFADEGWPGLVIDLRMRGMRHHPANGEVSLEVRAGEVWDDVVAFAVANQWAGIECLSGIPGRVGATPIQNVGAYGQEVGDCIRWVRVLDLANMTMTELDGDACQFAYRSSLFKTTAKDRYLILAVAFQLKEGGEPTVRYPDLQKRLQPKPSLADVRRGVLAVRREKAMVVEESEPNSRSCGSFFTNPILDEASYGQFRKRVPGTHPNYPAGQGKVKLSAAWLIEQAGFHKGFHHRNVGLSEKHCLAVVNRGGGTAEEVLELVAMIRKSVAERFEVVLWPEPVLLNAAGERLRLTEDP